MAKLTDESNALIVRLKFFLDNGQSTFFLNISLVTNTTDDFLSSNFLPTTDWDT